MIKTLDSHYTYDLGNYYTILPTQPKFKIDDFKTHFMAKKVEICFSYNSKDNRDFETVESLRELISTHISPL